MQQGPQMNPYAPPTPQHGGGMMGPGMGPPGSPAEAAQRGICPRCQSTAVRQPSFTWWGGMLGPKMFNHWVCGSCGFGYNGKTGESNTTKIAVYFIVINVVVIGLLIALNAR